MPESRAPYIALALFAMLGSSIIGFAAGLIARGAQPPSDSPAYIRLYDENANLRQQVQLLDSDFRSCGIPVPMALRSLACANG